MLFLQQPVPNPPGGSKRTLWMQKRSNTFESLLWALHIAAIDNLWLRTLDRSRIEGELCMFDLVHVWSCTSDFFLYLFGGFTNRGRWIEIGLWITFGGSWTHVGTLGYYWVRGLECLQFKVLRCKYEYVVHFCPPSIVSEQRQPAYAKRAWCIFESYVLSSAPRFYGNYRSAHSRLVDSSRWMFNEIWCCSNQKCFLFSSMMAIFTVPSSKVCIEQQLPMTIILPSSAESFFKETVESGGWLVRFSLIVDLLLCWYPAC